MNIEPGTRVRHADSAMPALNGELGTYLGMATVYYVIHWDKNPNAKWNNLHTEDEFEVIDE